MASPTEETENHKNKAEMEDEENDPLDAEGDVLQPETEQASKNTVATEPQQQPESDEQEPEQQPEPDEPYPNTASKSGGAESEIAAGQDDASRRNVVQDDTASPPEQKHEINPELDQQKRELGQQPKDHREELVSCHPGVQESYKGETQESDQLKEQGLEHCREQDSHSHQPQGPESNQPQESESEGHQEQESKGHQEQESKGHQEQESEGRQEQGEESRGGLDSDSNAELLPEQSNRNKNKAEDRRKFKIFVIGKTGTGKSTLCNRIVGRDAFATGRSFSQVTTKDKEEKVTMSELDITVVDTSDISTESEAKQKDTVREWKEKAKGCNYMIVLTVRCDTRYSPAEYEVYKQIKQLWGTDLCKRLVVAFTFGDAREDQSRDMKEELEEVWPELKDVIKDAKGRHVVFNNKPGHTEEKPVDELIDIMLTLANGERCKWAVGLIFVTMVGVLALGSCAVMIYKYVFLAPTRALGAIWSYWNGTGTNNSVKNDSDAFTF